MINYEQDLNLDQLSIVKEADGFCLVLAGAGSGKTRTLVYRTAYLLEKNIAPENILLMTFTNKAAQEMTAKIYGLLQNTPQGLMSGTFHRIGNLILRKYGYLLGFSPNFAILDEQDSKGLLKLGIKILGVDSKNKQFPKVEVISHAISFSRNSQQNLEDFLLSKYDFPYFIVEQILQISRNYQDQKKKNNALDFDDLLEYWLLLLENFNNVKNKLASQFRYILIDEYQDTNVIQAKIIDKLGEEHKNILAVGDDAQSIYSFRAANINNILDFPKNFTPCRIFKLETNYRSQASILQLANESIKNNTCQFAKNLHSHKGSGPKPVLVAAADAKDQANCVVQEILRLQNNKKYSLNDMAVLFRNSAHSLELQLFLSQHGIPFIVRSGQKYFEMAHIKDLLAFMRIWQNMQDTLSWMRILKMAPKIGDKTAQKIFLQISQSITWAKLLAGDTLPAIKQKYQGLQSLLSLFQNLGKINEGQKGFVAAGLNLVVTDFYKSYLQTTYPDAAMRLEDIAALIDFSAQYESLDNFLADITLNEKSAGEAKDADNERLVLSTIHQAKGLEWEQVFILGLRFGMFPHYRSCYDKTELEEERRLFYVAVTRAKKGLMFLYPVAAFSYGQGENYQGMSVFLEEIPENLYELNNFWPANNNFPKEFLTNNLAKQKEKKQAFNETDDPFFEDNIIEYD